MCRSIYNYMYMCQYNPPVPCGLFFTKASDESIFHFRSSYLASFFFLFIQRKVSITFCEQCRPWSDAEISSV